VPVTGSVRPFGTRSGIRFSTSTVLSCDPAPLSAGFRYVQEPAACGAGAAAAVGANSATTVNHRRGARSCAKRKKLT